MEARGQLFWLASSCSCQHFGPCTADPAQPSPPCMLLASVISAAVGRVDHHTSAQSAPPPAGLRWWKQTPVSGQHLCLPHRHLPGEGFQSHVYSQALPHAPTIILSHSFTHVSCLVSTYYMPDTVLGTREPPQNRQPSPCLRLSGGRTDK